MTRSSSNNSEKAVFGLKSKMFGPGYLPLEPFIVFVPVPVSVSVSVSVSAS